MTNTAFESFSAVASDVVRLRLAMYGPQQAQLLMRVCFRLSKRGKISEPTAWKAWQMIDDAWDQLVEADADPIQIYSAALRNAGQTADQTGCR